MMEVEVYICDNKEALVQTLGYLSGRAEILYTSPSEQGESGDIVRYLVRPPRSGGETFDSFADKLVVIARRE